MSVNKSAVLVSGTKVDKSLLLCGFYYTSIAFDFNAFFASLLLKIDVLCYFVALIRVFSIKRHTNSVPVH